MVYREWAPNPKNWVTYTIVEYICEHSKKEHYLINLIDPLAKKIQPINGRSVVDDMNEFFMQFRKIGKGMGGFWEGYDTKGTKGRDEIRRRLRNAELVKQPGRNKLLKDGREIVLPTLWIARDCTNMANSLRKWRYEDWGSSNVLVTKDRKETPAQKFSHFCTALEGIFKDSRFRKPLRSKGVRRKPSRYFQNNG